MTDFFVNPVYGYRAWKMDAETLELRALSWGDAWPTRQPMVSTHASEAIYRWFSYKPCKSGRPCSSCGIWAFDQYEDCERRQNGRAWRSLEAVALDEVRGVVAGWGNVVICSKGWRAGHAYPLAFLEWDLRSFVAQLGADALHWRYIMREIADRYDVPIAPTIGDLARIARSKGCVPAHKDLILEAVEAEE